jgi:sporulation protein YlmC with PRC-barrel domain
MKRTIAVAALAPLVVFPAVAQDNGAAQVQNKSPVTQDSATPSTRAQLTNGQISASALLDEKILNEANESIGDVNDVILDRDGKIASVIVGVGGFLGLGEKDVALPFDQLKFTTDNENGLVVTTTATKEGLEAAPAYNEPNSR